VHDRMVLFRRQALATAMAVVAMLLLAAVTADRANAQTHYCSGS
jgi:hypothetical protein